MLSGLTLVCLLYLLVELTPIGVQTYCSPLSAFSSSSFGMMTVGSVVFANRMIPALSMINQERLGRMCLMMVLGSSSSLGSS